MLIWHAMQKNPHLPKAQAFNTVVCAYCFTWSDLSLTWVQTDTHVYNRKPKPERSLRNKYDGCTSVKCTQVWCVHKCDGMTCTQVWHIHKCDAYTSVILTQVRCVHKCDMYTSMTCTQVWHVHKYNVYTSVTRTQVWYVHKCDVYTSVTCT